MTTYELLQYYVNLLIVQYLGLPKAIATVGENIRSVILPQVSQQQISITATSGLFTLSYNGNATPPWPYNSTDSQIQAALQALPGLSQVTVLNGLVTFTGVTAPALPLISSNATLCTVSEVDLNLPLAIQNAFNVNVEPLAEGVQLDILGKYAGVSRTGMNQNGTIVLSDSDFITLIKFATITNSSGSSLATIVTHLFQTFGSAVSLYDFQNMHMSYLINSSIGTQDLINLLITEDLLPRPMGVELSIIYANNTSNFFGFRTYASPGVLVKPFNTYADYNQTWPWLSYNDQFSGSGSSLLTEDENNLTQETGDLIYLG